MSLAGWEPDCPGNECPHLLGDKSRRGLRGVRARATEEMACTPDRSSAPASVDPDRRATLRSFARWRYRGLVHNFLSLRRIVAKGMLAVKPLRRLGCRVLMLQTTM